MTDPRDIHCQIADEHPQVAHCRHHDCSQRARRLRRVVNQLRLARIMAEWQITRVALGFVLSMELIGMAFGSIFLGSLADQDRAPPDGAGVSRRDGNGHVHGHGRRLAFSVDLVSLGVCAVWIQRGCASGRPRRCGASSPVWASAACWRAINAVVAEFSNTKRRDLNVAIMSIGYRSAPRLAAFITSTGLELANGARSFISGATVTIVMIPTVTS
jgi:MFS family permease